MRTLKEQNNSQVESHSREILNRKLFRTVGNFEQKRICFCRGSAALADLIKVYLMHWTVGCNTKYFVPLQKKFPKFCFPKYVQIYVE